MPSANAINLALNTIEALVDVDDGALKRGHAGLKRGDPSS